MASDAARFVATGSANRWLIGDSPTKALAEGGWDLVKLLVSQPRPTSAGTKHIG